MAELGVLNFLVWKIESNHSERLFWYETDDAPLPSCTMECLGFECQKGRNVCIGYKTETTSVTNDNKKNSVNTRINDHEVVSKVDVIIDVNLSFKGHLRVIHV